MAVKRVLVSYLDRNKVITIPDDTGEGDVQYVIKEFKKAFNFEGCVNLGIVLQKFDSEWDTYVDLEKNDALVNKDKVKAVVMPILEDRVVSSRTATPDSDCNADNSGEVCSSSAFLFDLMYSVCVFTLYRIGVYP